ncbi:hypothetical protein [Streptomyces celluloflavus]|uniref:hypothetical protein n=1 Tax=Streptomyces celluloflavus TaxID=58344 RepID=UPI0036B3EDEE
MSDPTRYSEPPVELPLDGRLLEGIPAQGCGACNTLDLHRGQARERGDWAAACAAAREIRNHDKCVDDGQSTAHSAPDGSPTGDARRGPTLEAAVSANEVRRAPDARFAGDASEDSFMELRAALEAAGMPS